MAATSLQAKYEGLEAKLAWLERIVAVTERFASIEERITKLEEKVRFADASRVPLGPASLNGSITQNTVVSGIKAAWDMRWWFK